MNLTSGQKEYAEREAGVLNREGDVFVEIVKNCSRDELMPVIQGKILENSKMYTDVWRACDG